MGTNAYLYTFPSQDAMPARVLRNGAAAYAVNAESTADALALLKSQYSSLPSIMFDRASEASVAAAADLAGWKFRVQVIGAFDTNTNSTPVVADVTVTGVAADTVSSLAGKAVTALNASGSIANAAYDGVTFVLTVAGAADVLGDHRVNAAFLPPNAEEGGFAGPPGYIADKADSGASSDALTLTLVADTYTVPTVVALLGESVAL